jgi:hypothetical protein
MVPVPDGQMEHLIPTLSSQAFFAGRIVPMLTKRSSKSTALVGFAVVGLAVAATAIGAMAIGALARPFSQ